MPSLPSSSPRRLQIGCAAREARDLGAGGGELPRDSETNALAAAGDDGDSVLHRDLHVVLPLIGAGFAFPRYWWYLALQQFQGETAYGRQG